MHCRAAFACGNSCTSLRGRWRCRSCPYQLARAGRSMWRNHPGTSGSGTCPDAGQVTAPGTGLDGRYEQLRHAALHARAEAFPLGLGVLTGKGVTTWQRTLAGLIPAATTRELTGVLAAMTLAPA